MLWLTVLIDLILCELCCCEICDLFFVLLGDVVSSFLLYFSGPVVVARVNLVVQSVGAARRVLESGAVDVEWAMIKSIMVDWWMPCNGSRNQCLLIFSLVSMLMAVWCDEWLWILNMLCVVWLWSVVGELWLTTSLVKLMWKLLWLQYYYHYYAYCISLHFTVTSK